MSNEAKHSIILVPGLDDGPDTWLMRLILRLWRSDGIKVDLCRVQWKDGVSYPSKLEKLLRLIDDLTKTGYTVSLVGISAGGSAAINALFAHPDKVHKVINICGRLKDGGYLGFRSLERQSRSSLAFRESVLLSEQNLIKANRTHLKKIMSIRARFGDELVPSDTSVVTGGYNVSVPVAEHGLTIAIALTLWRHTIMQFLDSDDIATS